MRFALGLCFAVAIGLAVLTVSHAQEPPLGYVPPDPALFSIPGGVRVAWAPVTGASRYAIRLGVSADDGTFIADDELANIDAGNRTFDVDAVLPHTEPLRCYTMRWRIYALIGTAAPEPPGEHLVRMCTDGGNRSSFGAPLPAPTPPSDVHLVRAGESWQLVWQDNSDNESAFDVDVALLNASGVRAAAFNAPGLPADTTSLAMPAGITSDAAPLSCYGAVFNVVARASDGTSSKPASYATAACIYGTTLTFPDAGAGQSPTDHPHLALFVAYALAIVGAALIDIARLRLVHRS